MYGTSVPLQPTTPTNPTTTMNSPTNFADFDCATASIDQINAFAWSIASEVSEGRLKAIAKEIRCRYRDFPFPDLLSVLLEDANGNKPLHPVCKRAMFRVMRQYIANLVSDVSKTPFNEFVTEIADIRPVAIKRKSAECYSAIEDVLDWHEVEFDLNAVANAYIGIVRTVRDIVNHISDSSNEMLYSVMFLEKHGIVGMDEERDAAIVAEFENRKRDIMSDLSNTDLDVLGTYLSLNANGYIEMGENEYNRFCEAVLDNIMDMVHKVAHKFPNLLGRESYAEITQDALAKMFTNLHSYCPSHGKFSTWAWHTVSTSMLKTYYKVDKTRFLVTESCLDKNEADDEKRSIMETANAITLRDYERQVLIQHIQSCADVLIERMPKFTPIIRAVFGDADGVATDDLDYASIARRSSRLAGKEQSSSYVRNIFENKIKPEFIRVFNS